jgi:hypothetical protein
LSKRQTRVGDFTAQGDRVGIRRDGVVDEIELAGLVI